MGRYLTPTKLQELLPGDWLKRAIKTEQLRDADGRPAGYAPLSNSHVEPLIEAAEAEADAYIGAAYRLPLPTAPAVLSQVIADIVRYRVCLDTTPESVRLRYADAVAFLGRVASGKASLGIAQTSEQPKPKRLGLYQVAPAADARGGY